MKHYNPTSEKESHSLDVEQTILPIEGDEIHSVVTAVIFRESQKDFGGIFNNTCLSFINRPLL